MRALQVRAAPLRKGAGPIIPRVTDTSPAASTVAAFITRWSPASGTERANHQLFITELCTLLDVPQPDPGREDTRDNAYVFERRVQFLHGDGSASLGFIDCYRRGQFVLEAKKLRAPGHTKGFDDAMLRARGQAEAYARALPAAEGRPPFLVVVDVGNVIELYAEFSRSGATYTPFPDPRSHRIALADLHDERIRTRLRTLWLDAAALDPARISAKVTRAVAGELALLATSLEADGPHGRNAPQAVAAFLTRCLFSMFAEDVQLLPERSFKQLLEKHREAPALLRKMLRALWADMDRGGFSVALEKDVLRFNGKLFKGAAADAYVLPLSRDQIDGLLRAASADWREVEPAIFGTLLERALEADERHSLGANFTPRSYVERLVLPTVIQPLRAEWADVQAAALLLATEGRLDEAQVEVRRFHHRLCTVRVLDPACGCGNFLYVTFEHLKRLEGEVLNQLEALLPVQSFVHHDNEGYVIAQRKAGAHVQQPLGLQGETVTLKQLLGIEINPRAAAVAELVLWIGFLQWHIRTFGTASMTEPVIHDYGNIECRDAVLAYDRINLVTDLHGKAVTRWDGKTLKPHPATGADVPDDSFQVALETYVNPRKADWPSAEFIVGNPPFIGARTIRAALGDAYLQALRSVYADIPDNADFVMYWWDKAASLVETGESQSFGLISTNSIAQSFCRKVIERHMDRSQDFGIRFAIADHPWIDAADMAAIRVAMTVVDMKAGAGRLQRVISETPSEDGAFAVTTEEQAGRISASLALGADPGTCSALRANLGVCSVGYQLTGQGFVVDGSAARALDPKFPTSSSLIRRLLTGRDLTQTPRQAFAIDLFGFTREALRAEQPAIYQWVFDRVKPERDQNTRASLKAKWWIFGEARSTFRPALSGTARAFATSLTAKHRTFMFVGSSDICDSTTVMFALPDASHFGVLCSRLHVQWALCSGGTLEDRPRYNKSGCFDPFPFPNLADQPDLAAQIAATAEELDALRMRQQAAHATLTLTDLYNVLDALRLRRPLSAKERLVHTNGLVSVLAELHDRLDALVLQAYGWSDLAPALVGQPGGTLPWPGKPAAQAGAEEELLLRLVALNTERAAEEARGLVRWLRPTFQDPALRAAAGEPRLTQEELDLGEAAPAAPVKGKGKVAAAVPAATRSPWPKTLPEQMRAVAQLLTRSGRPITLTHLEAGFTGRGPWKRRIPPILEALAALGRARQVNGLWTLG